MVGKNFESLNYLLFPAQSYVKPNNTPISYCDDLTLCEKNLHTVVRHIPP